MNSLKHPPSRVLAGAKGLAVATAILLGAPRVTTAQGTFEPIRVTFDGSPIQRPGTQYGVYGYYESGLWFRGVGPGPFTRNGGGLYGYPDNGTAYVQAMLGDSLAWSFTDGTVFDLRSVDLAEYSDVLSGPTTVHVVGYRHDGTVVATNLTTDGIFDGTGPLADFQTFTFGGEFTALDRVEMPIPGWSLDNLVLGVPEPSGAALLSAGLLLWWLGRVRGAGGTSRAP